MRPARDWQQSILTSEKRKTFFSLRQEASTVPIPLEFTNVRLFTWASWKGFKRITDHRGKRRSFTYN
jgi:hypothetical protein